MKILAVLLCVASISQAFAQTYYVSPTGSDSNPGTLAEPFLTWGKFGDICGAGDTLIVRAGTYSEFFRPWDKSGTAGNEIVIMNYPGEAPVMHGYDTIPDRDDYSNFGLIHFDLGYWKISGITVRNSGVMGIQSGGGHTTVSRCTTYNTIEGGIGIAGDSSIVEDCVVYNAAMLNFEGWCMTQDPIPSWGVGITAAGSFANPVTNSTIRRNLVYDSWGEGISSFTGIGCVIEDNTIYDSFSTYMYLSDVQWGIVRNNLVYATKDMVGRDERTTGLGIASEQYYYSGISDTIVGNIVWATGRAFDFGTDNFNHSLIANNTFVNSTEGPAIIIANAMDVGDAVFENNIIIQEDASAPIFFQGGATDSMIFRNNFWSKEPTAAAVGSGDIVGDAKLYRTGDSTAGNLDSSWFSLTLGSTAIDAGYNYTLPWWPYSGNARDMGAVEYSTPTVYYNKRLWIRK